MPLNNSSVQHKLRRFLVILRKIVLRTLIALVLLLLLVIGLIQFPAIQNYIKNIVVNSLTEKLQTKVKLGYIRINFAGNLVLEDLFVADRKQDTVINIQKLKVAINPAGLLRRRIIISKVALSGTHFNYIVLDEAGHTNIDFIIQSFAGEKKEEKQLEPSAWDIQIRKLQLEKSGFVYRNRADSMEFNLQVGRLMVNVDNTNLDSLRFDVDRILLRNTTARLLSYKLASASEKINQEPVEKDSAKAPSIRLKKLDLNSVTFIQADSATRSSGTYRIGEAHIQPKAIDLANQQIDISSLAISKSNITYIASPVHSEAAEANANVPAQKDTESWRIKVDDAKLQFERITLRNLVAGGGLWITCRRSCLRMFGWISQL